MNKKRPILLLFMLSISLIGIAQTQYDESGINAGFFDSSDINSINYTTFHLPPLAVLFENAKSNPTIQALAKAQEIAESEAAKEKRHIFSFINGYGSYSYGKSDMWGNNSSSFSQTIYQFQGSTQSYWNVGVRVSLPLDQVLDLNASAKRKRLEAERSQFEKEQAFDNLKLQIASLYIKITNNLVALKSASENAAIYQGAGALNQEQFHNGSLDIAAFADTKDREQGAVATYQALQTQITTDIITLELLTHTPIITNTTTDITMDNTQEKSEKQIAKENRMVEKRIKKAAQEEEKKMKELEKQEKEKNKNK
ncbi:MAG: TolC family protein [Prevotella sp.]|nr:TolC family protein [Prevotella sp.]